MDEQPGKHAGERVQPFQSWFHSAYPVREAIGVHHAYSLNRDFMTTG